MRAPKDPVMPVASMEMVRDVWAWTPDAYLSNLDRAMEAQPHLIDALMAARANAPEVGTFDDPELDPADQKALVWMVRGAALAICAIEEAME